MQKFNSSGNCVTVFRPIKKLEKEENMIYYFLLLNLLSFFLFGWDKKKSQKHEYRIPEKVLLLITFVGGTFGSLFGMFYFHHKSKKSKFLLLVPFSCLLWTFLFYLLK